MSRKLRGGAWLAAIVAASITFFVFLTGYASIPALLSALINPPNPWALALQDFAPSCYPSSSSTWVIPKGVKSSTNIKCDPSEGLVMLPSSTTLLAEIDLDKVNGQPYNQSKLDAQIRVTFLENTNSNTMAGLVVQTPQQGSGGYGLAINSRGYWELGDNVGHKKASAGETTSSSSFTIEMKIFQGNLYGFINDKQVFMYKDTMNPSLGAISLVVYGSDLPLSSVVFSDFTLNL